MVWEFAASNIYSMLCRDSFYILDNDLLFVYNVFPLGPSGLQSDKYDLTQRTLTSIQDQLNKFIESEKNAMEERIRWVKCLDSQTRIFAYLQTKFTSQ